MSNQTTESDEWQFFHATPYNLDGQTHILPPNVTGRVPHWEGMDPSEQDQVFLSRTLDSARGWGSDLAGMDGKPFHVYEVQPEGPAVGTHVVAASCARIVRRVFSYDPNGEVTNPPEQTKE